MCELNSHYGEVLVHIGRHKSGTSSVQQALCLHESQLALSGIVYSKCGRSKTGIANHDLAASCQQNDSDRLALYRIELENELRTARILVISSEAFQNLRDPMVFFSLFPNGVKFRVIAYLRDAVDYLASSYAQRIQNSNLTSGFYDYAVNRNLDYEGFLSKWKLQSSSVRAIFYHPLHLVDGDVVADFFTILESRALVQEDKALRRNPSIGGNLLYAKLQLNRMNIEFDTGVVYGSLSNAALQIERFSKGFWIDDRLVEFLRQKYIKNYVYLENAFGYSEMVSFSSKPLAPDVDNLQDDLQYISSLPGMQDIKTLLGIKKEHLGPQIGSA